MTWARTASSYSAVFENLRRGVAVVANAVRNETVPLVTNPPPRVKLEHFELMCDDTGLFQHAIHSVPDRQHGYCVDDNARALLVACALNTHGRTTPCPKLCASASPPSSSMRGMEIANGFAIS